MPGTVGSEHDGSLLDVSVVRIPPVDGADFPVPVDRTAGQDGEGLVGMIDIGHSGHIGGVNVLVVILTVGRRVGGVDVVARLIHQRVGAGVLVTFGRVVRPTVVPADAHRALGGVAARTIRFVILPEIDVGGVAGLPTPVIGRNRCGTLVPSAGVVFFQDSCGLPVGTCERNPQVADVGVFDLQPQVSEVFRTFDDAAVRVAAHIDTHSADAAAIAGYAVGNEQRLVAVELSIAWSLSPKGERQGDESVAVKGLLHGVALGE